MIDPARLLGGLLSGSLRRGLPRNAGLALGMGAVGVAIAAFEHFSQQRQAQTAGGASPSPPPLPRNPQPPGTAPTVPPPLPLQPVIATQANPALSDAMVLIRAMVAAAWSDGALDPDERETIVRRLATAGLDDEEQALAAHELEHPVSLEQVIASVSSRELAEQVYTVSLLAIRLDTGAEHAHLQRLAAGLALPPESVTRIHRLVGVPV